MSNLRYLAAALAFGGAIAVIPVAKASVILSDSTNGLTYSTVASSGSTNAPDNVSSFSSYPVGPFTITGYNAFDNVPGTAALATADVTTFSLANTGTSTATEYFFVGAGDFTLPTPPISFTTNWTANAVNGTLTPASFSEFGCVFANSAGLANSCAGTDTATTTGNSTANSGTSSVLASVASPYEMGAVLEVTLAAGQSYSVSVTDNATVPEPASLALLGSALVGLGLIRARLRRS